MKLKQRVVLLVALLLLLGLGKIFLLDGSEGTAASRRDLRAFRKVSERTAFSSMQTQTDIIIIIIIHLI